MKFNVLITEAAEQDIRQVFEWWSRNRSPSEALRWYEAIYPTIATLSRNPHRFGFASERDLLPTPLRHMLFGTGRKPTHRVIYTVDGNDVVILRIRHVAQDTLQSGDLPT